MQGPGLSALQMCFSILRIGLKQLESKMPTYTPSWVTVVFKISVFLLRKLLSREK